ncbi:MAG TPA: hypothetical protein VGN43_06905, partial [Steroidobacteraceae bacterium]|nr:hypothetical protein [Steroidobacteraceae bacterium]
MLPGAPAPTESPIPVAIQAGCIPTPFSSKLTPSPGGRSSNRLLETLLHRKLDEPYSVHGFRASFSSWAHAETDHPHELIELALAHTEGRGNAVARSYNRSDAL